MLIFPACSNKMENSSQRFPLATSIVSRRSSRSYSHQTFWRPVRESTNLAKVQKNNNLTSICQTTIAWGVVGGARYARRSHYQTARYSDLLSTSSYIVTSFSSNLAYYQPNIYHYHSTPWRYRWGRFVLENFHGDH